MNVKFDYNPDYKAIHIYIYGKEIITKPLADEIGVIASPGYEARSYCTEYDDSYISMYVWPGDTGAVKRFFAGLIEILHDYEVIKWK